MGMKVPNQRFYFSCLLPCDSPFSPAPTWFFPPSDEDFFVLTLTASPPPLKHFHLRAVPPKPSLRPSLDLPFPSLSFFPFIRRSPAADNVPRAWFPVPKTEPPETAAADPLIPFSFSLVVGDTIFSSRVQLTAALGAACLFVFFCCLDAHVWLPHPAP